MRHTRPAASTWSTAARRPSSGRNHSVAVTQIRPRDEAIGAGSRVIRQRPGQMIGGHAVGIIVLNVGYPLIPGNVANATTFPFPVRYRVIEGADIPRLLA